MSMIAAVVHCLHNRGEMPIRSLTVQSYGEEQLILEYLAVAGLRLEIDGKSATVSLMEFANALKIILPPSKLKILKKILDKK